MTSIYTKYLGYLFTQNVRIERAIRGDPRVETED